MTLESVLYPPLEPYRVGRLAVDDLHTLHWEACGNPAGVPVVFLHGGPGAGISPKSRRFFDPARYHIILFDQRGSGQSTPLGETRTNTTQLLIEDIERLRALMGIDQWLVFGGSWGATLALTYAQAHPAQCLGLVLRGIWLGTEAEIEWWLYGVRNFFPREWQAFAAHVPAAERDDLLGAYTRRMTSPDLEVRHAAAEAWRRYEGACLYLRPEASVAAASTASVAEALSVGLLEAHYFHHHFFLQPGQLLQNMPCIAHLPGVVVHGRYDVICPVRYAYDLTDAWPGVQLTVVADAGHSSYELGIAAELCAATARFASTAHFN